jgi:Ohr subfamily peroxiredoxin
VKAADMDKKVLYTAHVRVQGGRDGHARTSDGILDVALGTPPELGGTGAGTNPEQLFAAGYGACFESAVRLVARRERIELGDVHIDVAVSLVAAPERSFALSADLDVTLESLPAPEAVELVRAASRICPYAVATHGNMDTTIVANGEPI